MSASDFWLLEIFKENLIFHTLFIYIVVVKYTTVVNMNNPRNLPNIN